MSGREYRVYNLTQNALFHAASATHLHWSAEPDGGDLVITVEDNGPGVPEKKKISIFNPAFGRSHGFGLYLVSEILSITEITIIEAGVFGEGAKFLIRVPEGRWRSSPASDLLSRQTSTYSLHQTPEDEHGGNPDEK